MGVHLAPAGAGEDAVLRLRDVGGVDGVVVRVADDAGAAGGYLWLGVVGGLAAYLVWFRGLGLLPVTSTALLGLLSPVVAAGLGWLVLDQALRPVQLLGFAIALVAIVGGQRATWSSSSVPASAARW